MVNCHRVRFRGIQEHGSDTHGSRSISRRNAAMAGRGHTWNSYNFARDRRGCEVYDHQPALPRARYSVRLRRVAEHSRSVDDVLAPGSAGCRSNMRGSVVDCVSIPHSRGASVCDYAKNPLPKDVCLKDGSGWNRDSTKNTHCVGLRSRANNRIAYENVMVGVIRAVGCDIYRHASPRVSPSGTSVVSPNSTARSVSAKADARNCSGDKDIVLHRYICRQVNVRPAPVLNSDSPATVSWGRHDAITNYFVTASVIQKVDDVLGCARLIAEIVGDKAVGACRLTIFGIYFYAVEGSGVAVVPVHGDANAGLSDVDAVSALGRAEVVPVLGNGARTSALHHNPVTHTESCPYNLMALVVSNVEIIVTRTDRDANVAAMRRICACKIVSLKVKARVRRGLNTELVGRLVEGLPLNLEVFHREVVSEDENNLAITEHRDFVVRATGLPVLERLSDGSCDD